MDKSLAVGKAQYDRQTAAFVIRETKKKKNQKSFKSSCRGLDSPSLNHSHLIPQKRESESPSQRATPELSKVNKFTNKIKQRESSHYPFQSTNICLMGVCAHAKLQHVTAGRPHPWKSEQRCGCQLASECALQGSGLCLQPPSPGSSITHVNTRQ